MLNLAVSQLSVTLAVPPVLMIDSQPLALFVVVAIPNTDDGGHYQTKLSALVR